ncbi:MAG: hypothetical protein ACKOTH_10020, partial [Solirubrobacterales bacterium]
MSRSNTTRSMARLMVPATGLMLALVLAVGVRPAAADTFPTGYNPSGYPTSGCFWTGAFTRSNAVTNVAFPGT